MARDAGVGAELDMRIGGKVGPTSGDPVDLRAKVIGMEHNGTQSFGPEDFKTAVQLGDTVAVRANGIDIVLNSIRTQVFSPDCFKIVGIDPQHKHILVVKSHQHFYAAFAPLAAEVFYIATPGAINPDVTKVSYRRIDENKWPFVPNPFGGLQQP
jgi:microcystin degradation protein MlrC